jgi:hypothetical protein
VQFGSKTRVFVRNFYFLKGAIMRAISWFDIVNIFFVPITTLNDSHSNDDTPAGDYLTMTNFPDAIVEFSDSSLSIYIPTESWAKFS